MENKLQKLLQDKSENILNIYFTAGYPQKDDTVAIINELDKAGVDIIELGIPYSDPLADGTTIQESSKIALQNGINLQLAVQQVKEVRKTSSIPVIIMGYYNQFLQYGIEKLLQEAADARIDGMIIPDLPMDYYDTHYRALFDKYNISISFLVTPETSSLRIRQADKLSNGFLYVVAQSSITGGQNSIRDNQIDYFERLKNMHLRTPKLIGFGIHDNTSFEKACEYAHGAIIGSAFIRLLRDNGIEAIPEFVRKIRKG